MIFCFYLLVFIFLVKSENLLLSLLVLEMLSFFLLYFVGSMTLGFSFESYLICLFALFVMEGVIGLSGLILLVSFSGSDYTKMSSVLKC